MATDLGCSSPTSETYTDDTETPSIRDKVLLKRSISKHHNNNFKAGYVPVNEQYLNKTGLRGRKTFAFWTLVGLLFILVIGNLIITMTILGVLRLGQGMQSIELVPDEQTIKFFGNADLGHLYKEDGKIEGFYDEPVHISSDENSVMFNIFNKRDRPETILNMNKSGTQLNVDLFNVKNKLGNIVFSTNLPNFKSFHHGNSIKSHKIEVNRLTSALNDNLKIESKNINFDGAEGTKIDAKEMIWTADSDIHLSANGSIILSAKLGTLIDVTKIPIAKTSNYVSSQYKVCVCMPEGKLFRIPIPDGSNNRAYCNFINTSQQNNPCD